MERQNVDDGDLTVNLTEGLFTSREMALANVGALSASTFQYSTGVAGLRIKNAVGEIEMLPFQGQQIWRARFYGRALTMRTMFPEPIPNVDYVSTYGAFLIHCGAAGMGSPGPHDNHAAHGELPNATYNSATLVVGRDERGSFISVMGEFKYTVAFSQNYFARPKVTIREKSGRLDVEMEIENLKLSAMEYMYLTHINYLPVDNGRIIDTVPEGKESCYITHTFENLRASSPEYKKMIEAYEADPESHRRFNPSRIFDPEIVLAVHPKVDSSGWASSLHLLPDGQADFVRHRTDQFDHSLRWIVRSPDMDALGLLLPSTAEPDGYTAEKAKGNISILPPKSKIRYFFECGALSKVETAQMVREIEAIA
jgi:hypothetical protein